MEEIQSLNPTDRAILQKLVDAGLPGVADVSRDTLKGHNILPGFSAASAEYAYDKWEVKSSDIYVVSYPKTGLIWMGEILRRLVYQEKEWENFSRILPMHLRVIELGGAESFELLDKLAFPRRLLASHFPADLINVEKIKKAGAKIVYVLRNPKDQMVSWMKFIQSIPNYEIEPTVTMVNSGWDKYFEHVVAGDFPMNMKPGDWYPDHILSWYPHRDNKNVRFVYFEDLKKDMAKQIKLLSEYLEIPATDEKIKEIAEASDFNNMKKAVETNYDDETIRSVKRINLRKGIVSGWKEYFSDDQSKRIDEIMEEKFKNTEIKFTYAL